MDLSCSCKLFLVMVGGSLIEMPIVSLKVDKNLSRKQEGHLGPSILFKLLNTFLQNYKLLIVQWFSWSLSSRSGEITLPYPLLSLITGRYTAQKLGLSTKISFLLVCFVGKSREEKTLSVVQIPSIFPNSWINTCIVLIHAQGLLFNIFPPTKRYYECSSYWLWYYSKLIISLPLNVKALHVHHIFSENELCTMICLGNYFVFMFV